ncbi:DUF1059 domain-containing protein [Candidatus Woesearchaeota archaeon]|nr:DUF1059 domain-containing protein [Candidatus Woesearchaeota archaeon]
MKTMNCKQLGGACNKEFHAETFEEIVEMSKNHGMEIYQKNDKDHIKAMEEMKKLMTDPQKMIKWMESKRKEFNSLPEDK